MTKFFNKFKKRCFWPSFDPFSQIFGQKYFSQKTWLSCTISYVFLVLDKNSKKTYDTVPRKCLDRRRDRRMDTPYFIGYCWGSKMKRQKRQSINRYSHVNFEVDFSLHILKLTYFICIKEPDDVNYFTKSFAHIQFYCPHYIMFSF